MIPRVRCHDAWFRMYNWIACAERRTQVTSLLSHRNKKKSSDKATPGGLRKVERGARAVVGLYCDLEYLNLKSSSYRPRRRRDGYPHCEGRGTADVKAFCCPKPFFASSSFESNYVFTIPAKNLFLIWAAHHGLILVSHCILGSRTGGAQAVRKKYAEMGKPISSSHDPL
jgi:hypothetical protein